MRIALTHAYSWPEVRRGAERIIRDLSRALARRGHDVTVFSAGAKAGRSQDDGVTIRRLRRRFTGEMRHEFDFGLRLAPRLAAQRFDVVHALGTRDAVAAIRAGVLRGHTTVYTNLGIPYREWWDARRDGAAHRTIVEKVDIYGGMSKFALRVLADEWGRTGALTPGGVDTTQFQPAAERAPRPTILFSGALSEERKGGATLVAALGLLATTVPDVQLWLSGPGDPAALLAAASPAARERIEVLPLGGPDEQAERYGTAWVTALPSKHDSFGMVLVESLACGTPIVVSTHAALPELVTAGTTGTLCEPDDPDGLAAALAAGLDLASRPGTVAACRNSANAYDWDASIAPAFEALYRVGHDG